MSDTDTPRDPLEGLADWLEAEALDATPRDYEKLMRWASEVESRRIAATGQAVTLEEINQTALASEALDEASFAHDYMGNNSAAEHCRARAYEIRKLGSKLLAATPATDHIAGGGKRATDAKPLLRKVGERPTVCYCPPGVCQAPKGFSGPCNRASEQPQSMAEKLNVDPAWADEPTPKPQEGQWTLTAPDGRRWTAESPLRVCAAESRERVPAHVALARIARGCDEPAAHAANDEPMNFVVAYPYPGEEHRLSIYTYGSDVQQQGTMEHAAWLLERARTCSPGKPWVIYRVEFVPTDSSATDAKDADSEEILEARKHGYTVGHRDGFNQGRSAKDRAPTQAPQFPPSWRVAAQNMVAAHPPGDGYEQQWMADAKKLLSVALEFAPSGGPDHIPEAAGGVQPRDGIKENIVQQAVQWAQEARTQRATVLDILRYFDLPEHDWEALRLIKAKLEPSGGDAAQEAVARPTCGKPSGICAMLPGPTGEPATGVCPECGVDCGGRAHLDTALGVASVDSASNAARLDWCIRTVEKVKSRGREGLGDDYPELIAVVAALKVIAGADTALAKGGE